MTNTGFGALSATVDAAGEGAAVAVTGANGFIGRRVCELLERGGVRTIRLVRLTSQGPERSHATPVDYARHDELAQILRRCKAVIHCAGIAHRAEAPPADGRLMAEERQLGRSIAVASLDAEVPAFIMLSSVAAASEIRNVDGDAQTDSIASYARYAQRKRMAEAEIEASLQTASTKLVIVRASMVFGPGMKGNPLALWQRISTGRWLVLPTVECPRPMTFVDNLVHMLISIANKCDQPSKLTYFDWKMSVRSFAEQSAEALGVRAKLLSVQRPWLSAAKDVLIAAESIGIRSKIRAAHIRTLLSDAGLTTGQGEEASRPVVTAEEAFRQTATWWLSRMASRLSPEDT